MATMKWSAVGDRFFEAGVDRGALYVDGYAGVAWDGLISVQETSAGDTAKEFYLDGVKFMNKLTRDEFQATITAYTYPDLFGICDGTASVGNGLFARHQSRKPFGFSYRTKVGNDVDGSDNAYKIHLVYGATAKSSNLTYKTLGDNVDALNFSWAITTKPSLLPGFAPSAHFVIDSRETPSALLGRIEGILYGTDQATPRLPDAGEMAYLFTSFNNTDYDAGSVLDIAYYTYDAGDPSTVATEVLDGGSP